MLVPIVDDGAPRRLLLTRRSEHLPTHGGHVAFPGGMVDDIDGGPEACALREAWEEIGLPPKAVEVLELLDDLPTVHDDVAVTPVVGRLAALPTLHPNPAEVARIFTIPLERLGDPFGWQAALHPWRGRAYPLFSFAHQGESLWGLSAFITLDLLARLGLAPFPLPFVELE